MSSYSKLKSHVESEKLDIVYLVSPPRTLSTVLEIALSETADGQIHEPFHIGKRQTFEEGCALVLDRANYLMGLSERKKTRIVVKDISKHLADEEANKLFGISSAVIFIIREPSLQTYSFLKRRANDTVEHNFDGLSDDQILDRLPLIERKSLLDDSWIRTERLVEICRETRTPDGSKDFAVISGLSFLDNPRTSLNKLRKQFNWDVSVDRLLSGWHKAVGENFFSPEFKYGVQGRKLSLNGAWLREAYNTRRFAHLSRNNHGVRDISKYPDFIQDYFRESILPAYSKLMLDPRNLSVPPFIYAVDEGSICYINPVEGYLVCCMYMNHPGLYFICKNEAKLLLDRIYRDYPQIHKGLAALPNPIL